MAKSLKRYIPLVVFITSFLYYLILCAKEYTWLFASGDSGDWLAASAWWMVPQPPGSPLFICMGHLVNLLPGRLDTNLTVLLSVIPAAIAVMLVYLIVVNRTGKILPGIAASTILLGSAVLLSQATVLEQYSSATMFMVLGIYFYSRGNRKMTALSLGLGTATHAFIGGIAILWLVLHAREWRLWIKPGIIYIISGILPYTFILWLLSTDAPRLLAGGLSFDSLQMYIGNAGVIGSLAATEAPQRLLLMGQFLLVSFGLSLVAVFVLIRQERSTIFTRILIMITVLSLWYVATCMDSTSWVFLIWGAPAIALMAGLGLAKMNKVHQGTILVGAVVLVLANGFLLNADKLNDAEPMAREYYQSIQALPDDRIAIVSDRVGWEALGIFYAMSQGKDIIPIIYGEIPTSDSYLFYAEWLRDEYGIEGGSAREQVAFLLNKGVAVYTQTTRLDTPRAASWETRFELEDIDNRLFDRIIGVGSAE